VVEAAGGWAERTRVRTPSHVAIREVGDETVVLNLATGDYHGLDSTGTAFLAALEDAPTVGGAVDSLLATYAVERDQLLADLRAFCLKLAERGLIELEDDEPA
jgi:hypothetical protein